MITGSILLALALESFWGQQADRRAEAVLLTSLAAELEGTRQEMLRARGVHKTRCDATAELRELFLHADDADPRAIGILMRQSASVTSVDAPLGVLLGLISSVSLELISDASLRSALAGWPAKLEDHREAEIYIHDVVRDQWVPWLVTHSVLTDDWGRGDAQPPGATASRILVETLSNTEFQNLVTMQDYYCSVVLGESDRLEDDIQELQARVLEHL